MGRGIAKATRAIIERALELLETVYKPASIVPTVRQVFYALAVEGFVPKSEKGYDKVQTTLADARERGDYPWDGIFDGLRQLHEWRVFGGLPEYFREVRQGYCLDRWQYQARCVEVWIEKDTVRGTVERLCGEMQVPLLVGRGYLSLTAKNEACRRLAEKPRTIIYVGDFDPSGVNMLEEAEEWVRSMSADGADLVVDRIAIDEDDHRNPELLKLPVNVNDARAKGYRQRFGDEVTEVEALPPLVLQARVRAAIERHLDVDVWTYALELEAEHETEIAARLGVQS